MKMFNRFISFCLCLSSTLTAALQSTHVVRAAIDIGMGGPKLQVAEVDLETHTIVKMVHTERYFVNFYDDIAKSSECQLSSEVMAQGLLACQEAVNKARLLGADGVVAIATAAFRAAGNGEQFADTIQSETGIPVHIIDQQLEGKLAFCAVLSKLDVDAEHLVVWDVGGGSVQFVSAAPHGDCFIEGLEPGVGAFRDYVIENIQHRNRKEITSPNPMSMEDVVLAERYAFQLSHEVGQALRDKIQRHDAKVVGVGSVFGYGVYEMLERKNPFSVVDLEAVVRDLPGKTDMDLGGGDYAAVEGTNVIFVLGLMRNLKIEQMEILNVNNADGAMLYEPFWD